MALPNPSMSFSPFAILTAEEMNDLVENIEALSSGTGLADGAVTTAKLDDEAVTSDKLDWTDLNISFFARLSGDQTSANGAVIKLNVEDYDYGNNFNTSTWKFVAPVKGLYHFDGNIATSIGTAVLSSIIRTSTTYGNTRYRGVWVGGSGFIASHCGTDCLLDAGDSIQLECTQMGGTATANGSSEADEQTYMNGHIVYRVS